MRKLLNVSLVLIITAFTLTSCNCYTKMMKKAAPGITTSCSPEILTLKGDNAIGTLTVNIPAKSFHPYGVMKITPVIKYDGGEVAGEPKFVQGEKVADNYTVISSSTGGSYQHEVSFPYNPQMRMAQLVLRVEAKCLKQGNKIKNFTEYESEIPVAYGVSSLQLLADNYAKVAIAPDSYVRTNTTVESANIKFQVNKFDVRANQLNTNEIASLQKFINESNANPKSTVGEVYTQAYASPEGPVDYNDKLSKNRGESTKKAVESKFKKDKVNATGFDINAMGEDWDGFQELVANSDIQDKELILQVLSMYKDPQVRDREIRNMSVTFKVLQDKILPELRRSKMTVNVETAGLTDAELKTAVASDVNSLNVEEMLFSATLFNDNATKAKVYQAAADKYNDFRGWNNLGVVKAQNGDYSGAKSAFQKAASLNNSNAQVINNLGVVALAEGKKADAAKFFAASTAPEAKYNRGLVELANGNYAAAISSLDGYNKALAQLLNGNISAAKAGLTCKCWKSDYLKAVIAAQEGDVNGLTTNLKSAIEKSSEAKKLAETEVNFLKYADNAEIAQLVSIKKPN